MLKVKGKFLALLIVATSCLVANDCVRFAFSVLQLVAIDQPFSSTTEEESRGSSGFQLVEEDAKHKDFYPSHLFIHLADAGLATSIVHLIQDDDVRHLADMSILVPPPR